MELRDYSQRVVERMDEAEQSFLARQSIDMNNRGIYGNIDTVTFCIERTRLFGDPEMGIKPQGTFFRNRFASTLYDGDSSYD